MNTTIDVHITPQGGTLNPRGARFGAWLYLAVRHALVGLFGRPAARKEGDVSRDVYAVREIAREYERIDPRIASDLYAAADRHERRHGLS